MTCDIGLQRRPLGPQCVCSFTLWQIVVVIYVFLLTLWLLCSVSIKPLSATHPLVSVFHLAPQFLSSWSPLFPLVSFKTWNGKWGSTLLFIFSTGAPGLVVNIFTCQHFYWHHKNSFFYFFIFIFIFILYNLFYILFFTFIINFILETYK